MRKFLINLLGGYTEKEYIEANRHSYNEGASEALLTLKLKADILYGIPADEWSKQIYKSIVELKKQYDDESDENQKWVLWSNGRSYQIRDW